MADDPRHRVIEQAHRTLAAARRVGFSLVAQRRLEQAIEWMETEVAPPSAEPCEHDWRYTHTDYHGSHKDEDHYRCSRCGATEYRT